MISILKDLLSRFQARFGPLWGLPPERDKPWATPAALSQRNADRPLPFWQTVYQRLRQHHSAVSPAKLEIALHALEGLEADRAEVRKQWDLQLQRAEYEAELAQRRYEAADPANRLVAAELEAQWE